MEKKNDFVNTLLLHGVDEKNRTSKKKNYFINTMKKENLYSGYGKEFQSSF